MVQPALLLLAMGMSSDVQREALELVCHVTFQRWFITPESHSFINIADSSHMEAEPDSDYLRPHLLDLTRRATASDVLRPRLVEGLAGPATSCAPCTQKLCAMPLSAMWLVVLKLLLARGKRLNLNAITMPHAHHWTPGWHSKPLLVCHKVLAESSLGATLLELCVC